MLFAQHVVGHGMSGSFAGAHGENYGGGTGSSIAAGIDARNIGSAGFGISSHTAFFGVFQIRCEIKRDAFFLGVRVSSNVVLYIVKTWLLHPRGTSNHIHLKK